MRVMQYGLAICSALPSPRRINIGRCERAAQPQTFTSYRGVPSQGPTLLRAFVFSAAALGLTPTLTGLETGWPRVVSHGLVFDVNVKI